MRKTYAIIEALAVLFTLNCATNIVSTRPYKNESPILRRPLLSHYLTETESARNADSDNLERRNLAKGLENIILGCPLDDGEFEVGDRFGMRMHPVYHEERMHTGVDYKAKGGTGVRASDDGEVVFVGKDGGYGLRVVIEHGEARYSLQTTYSHLRSSHVKKGQHVKGGDVIAEVGHSGIATGDHLHYEVALNGIFKDPLKFIYFPKPEEVTTRY